MNFFKSHKFFATAAAAVGFNLLYLIAPKLIGSPTVFMFMLEFLALTVGVYFIYPEQSAFESYFRFGWREDEFEQLGVERKKEIQIMFENLDKIVNNTELSAAIRQSLKAIEDKIKKSLTSKSLHLGSHFNEYYTIIKSVSNKYLPQMVENYLGIPPAMREVMNDNINETPERLFHKQIQVLDEQLEGILLSISKEDMQEMVVYDNFLKEKFGKNTSLQAFGEKD